MDTQQSAFEKLSRLKVGALFCETGTGKTKIALDLMASKRAKVEVLVWICPASLKAEIERERQKWHPELELHVYSCEGIAGSDRIFNEVYSLVEKRKAFIVVDESLKIKNITAKTTKRIIFLGKKATYKLILNGTPVSKNICDLWAQMQFLSPTILKQTFDEFKKMYCIYDTSGRYQGYVKECVNVEHLISRIQPYIFEAKLDIKAQASHEVRYYQITDMPGYERIKADFLKLIEQGSYKNCSFVYLATALQHFYCNHSTKDEVLAELLAEINEPTIVFCKFRDSIPEEAPAITGDVPAAARVKLFDDFKEGKFKTLYLMRGCGSFGLNLQFCHNMIFAEQTWDYAMQLQAEARVYRTGQEEDVNYYHLICADVGLENMIFNNLNKKSNLLVDIKKTINKAADPDKIARLIIERL